MKGHIRFTNGIVAIEQIEGFTWKLLDEDDPLREKFRNKEHEHIDKFFSVLIFLKGGHKFLTSTTKNNLDKMIKRFKVWNKNDNENEELVFDTRLG